MIAVGEAANKYQPTPAGGQPVIGAQPAIGGAQPAAQNNPLSQALGQSLGQAIQAQGTTPQQTSLGVDPQAKKVWYVLNNMR
jgi:hypothetical protein